MTKKEVLEKLQKIQAENIGIIDCDIQTRKDMNCMQIVFNACNYGFDKDGKIDKRNRSKLYVHRFEWKEPNYESEFKLIDAEIKLLKDQYK